MTDRPCYSGTAVALALVVFAGFAQTFYLRSYFGAPPSTAMVAVGLPTAFAAAARGSAPPGIPPLVFLVVPVFDILWFARFVTAAR